MKYADKIGAVFTMVLGDEELKQNCAELKHMQTGEKTSISLGEGFLTEFVAVATQTEDNAAMGLDGLTVDFEGFEIFEKED